MARIRIPGKVYEQVAAVLGRADPPALIRAIEELHEGREMVQAEKKADVKRGFGFRVREEYRQ